MFIAMACT